MSSGRRRLCAAILTAQLLAFPPMAVAQDAVTSALKKDEQKTLDLLNRGMDLDRAGKLKEAEQVYRRWINETAEQYGANGLITSLGYRVLAGNLEAQGRVAEAENYWRQLLDINRTQFGEQDDETLLAYAGLASNYGRQGRPADALPLRRTILAGRIAQGSEQSAKAIIATNNLASTLSDLGQYAESEALFRKAVAASLATHGDAHPETATSYGNLAVLLRQMGRYSDAAPLLEKALKIDAAISGEKSPVVALRYYNISANLGDQGRYAEAGVAADKALTLWRETSGEDSVQAAMGYTAVAFNLSNQGRFAEASPMYREALAIRQKRLGERHPLTAESYGNLAQNMTSLGVPPSSVEPVLRKALDIARSTLGDNNERTATFFGNVASNLSAQGRYAEAEPVYRRALDIRTQLSGTDHPAYATLLVNLGENLRHQGRTAQAEPLMRQALAIFRAKFGEENPDTAFAYANLASALGDLGRRDEATAMTLKVLNIRRRLLGDNHPLTAIAYNNMGAAVTLSEKNSDVAAEPYYRQSLAILLRSVGEAHGDTAQAYNSLSSNLRRQGRNAEAEQASLKAVGILRRLRDQAAAKGSAVTLAGLDRQQADPDRNIFTNYMNAAFGLMPETPTAIGQSDLQNKAFMAAQDAISSASGRAVLQTAARAAAKTPAMAEAVRQEQDLAARANMLDKNLLTALSARNAVDAAKLRGELAGVQAQLADVSALIDRKYPSYRELVSPRPVGLKEAQAALRPDEGLLLLTETANVVHLFVVTPTAVVWNRPSVETNMILKQIADLRCDVDFANCSNARKAELEKIPQTPMEQAGRVRFDLNTANALYKALIAPVEPQLKGLNRLYVTSSGKLGDLPLAMLSASALPSGADIADPDILARAEWLSNRFAFTSLPSVAALTLYNDIGKGKRGRTFRGYGNPLLAGGDATSRAGSGVGVFRGAMTRDGAPLADPQVLRTLTPLPGTKIELTAMATLFGQSASSLALEGGATEAALKQDPKLATSNVIAIATHGLLPDPELGFSEPGLVLTPPATPNEVDDGLLTASEAAKLTLSADWVVLSACNTASAEGSGGSDSLSALARGFLYAGADALLASHWRVSDDATAVLTVETLAARQSSPNMTRAQALQRGMETVRTGKRADGSAIKGWTPDWAHPSAWAAFTNIANRDD